MSGEARWVRSPVSRVDRHWATNPNCKSVLVMVPHIVAGTRLFDLLALLENDKRLQVVFTQPESWETWQATHDFLAVRGGVVLPWAQARRERYDLVLAGSIRGMDEVNGPALLIPHGGGLAQYRRWRPETTGESWAPVLNMDRDQLMRHGKVLAEAIVLTHDDEMEVLTVACPPAVPYAVVAGDIAFDRMTASLPLRDHYRAELGLTPGQELVVVSSTWSTASAFGRRPDLFDVVQRELPADRYRVVGLLHPNVWSHHGAWQVRTWLADNMRSGLGLVPPEEGWRAALVGADHVIGDYGSVTTFAAGLGRPILRSAEPDGPLRPGSPSSVLAEVAPRWEPERPLEAQLAAARALCTPELGSRVRGLLTSRPGAAAAILREAMYRLLRLVEPDQSVVPLSLPAPTLLAS
ncbi:hypothetical protein [Actinokineospora diospyrosa]|uniref:hypothetical protein n=1 Tax=Actinokineospora diospyrosa TaxID=103728 RepID=UPI0020A2FD3B|nr:hypothetical protein [Actinokineospora diospyrosa]